MNVSHIFLESRNFVLCFRENFVPHGSALFWKLTSSQHNEGVEAQKGAVKLSQIRTTLARNYLHIRIKVKREIRI
jgi:hypothetical protein